MICDYQIFICSSAHRWIWEKVGIGKNGFGKNDLGNSRFREKGVVKIENNLECFLGKSRMPPRSAIEVFYACIYGGPSILSMGLLRADKRYGNVKIYIIIHDRRIRGVTGRAKEEGSLRFFVTSKRAKNKKRPKGNQSWDFGLQAVGGKKVCFCVLIGRVNIWIKKIKSLRLERDLRVRNLSSNDVLFFGSCSGKSAGKFCYYSRETFRKR